MRHAILAQVNIFTKDSSVGKSWKHLLLPLFLLLVVGISFFPSLKGTFIWDDINLIQRNRNIRSFDHLWHNISSSFWDLDLIGGVEGGGSAANIYYRPLITLSYMIDYAIYGLSPWGYHLSNLLMHLLAVWLAFLLAKKIFSNEILAALSALIFGLHPSRGEAVIWISGRTDIMMTVFFLLSLLFFWRALSLTQKRKWVLAGAWFCYVAAILCKETAVALAVLVPALDYFFLSPKEGSNWRRNFWWCHFPLILVTVIFICLRVAYQNQILVHREAMPLLLHLIMFLETLTHYALLIINPYEPNFQVAPFFDPTIDSSALRVGAGALLLIICSIFLVWAWVKKHRFGWALLLFVATLAPVSNLVPLHLRTLVAERFLYLPILGIALLVGFAIAKSSTLFRHALVVLTVLFCVSFATVNAIRSLDFTNELRLWKVTQASSPDNPLAQQKIAIALMRQGRSSEAEKWFEKSLRNWIRVRSPHNIITVQLAWLEIHLLSRTDRDTDFLAKTDIFLKKLLEMDSKSKPGENKRAEIEIGKQLIFVEAKKQETIELLARKAAAIHSMRGVVQNLLGLDQEAIRSFLKALALKPRRVETMINLALAYARLLDIEKAQEQVLNALSEDPNSQRANSLKKTLQLILPRILKIRQIQNTLQKTLDAATNGHRLLAEVHVALKAPRRAREHLEKLVRLSPNDRNAYSMLALEWAASGHIDKAYEVIRAAREYFGPEPGLEKLEAEVRAVYYSNTNRALTGK